MSSKLDKRTEQTTEENYLYIRVSTSDQASGAETQITITKEYASKLNKPITKVYQDIAISGVKADRKAFNELKEDLKKRQFGTVNVFVYDVTRIAREMGIGVEFIKTTIEENGAKIFSPISGEIDYKTPVGRMMYHQFLSMADFERSMINERTKNGQKSLLKLGVYPFSSIPFGYKRPKKGLLVRDEPLASVIEKALEKYVNNELESLKEVAHYMTERGYKMTYKRLSTLLHSNKLLCGILDYPEYDVLEKTGNWTPVISPSTYDKVMNKLTNKHTNGYNINIESDFTFRRLVSCAECGKALSAGYSTNRVGDKYGYYFCLNSKCYYHRKNIKKADLESSILNIINATKINIPLERIKYDFDFFFGLKDSERKQSLERYQSELLSNQARQRKTAEKLLNTESQAVIQICENELEKLTLEAINIQAVTDELNKNNLLADKELYWSKIEKVAENLTNTSLIFEKADYSGKRQLVKDLFQLPITYHYATGLRTLKKAHLVDFLVDFDVNLNLVAEKGERLNIDCNQIERLINLVKEQIELH